MTAERDARDRAWLQQAAAGGPEANAALDGLMQAYNLGFLRYLMRKGIDHHTAEDARNDMWTELALTPLHCPADRVPLHWLMRVLRHRGRRLFWGEKRKRMRHALWQAEVDTAPVAPGPELAAQFRQLAEAMGKLEGSAREALELVDGFYRRGWTIEDLATWRYERCRPQHCRCATGTRKDCERGTLSATRKAVSRARLALKELAGKFI